MTRLQLASLTGLAFQFVKAYPSRPHGAFQISDLLSRQTNDEFVFAAIGDSWASGVQYSFETQYDDNSSGCQRLKNGWATIVRDHGKEWGPENFEPKLCFEACSGRQMQHMGEELDKCADRRPEITIMEVSGNDADFYPMADNCIFHKFGVGYGTLYEDDDANNPQGACRKSIKEVRKNIESIEEKYKNTIQMWKQHRANQGNDATLFTVGYGQFFGMNDECDNWNFQIPWGAIVNPIFLPAGQTLKKAMRQEFNDMIGLVNSAIESATKSFNDPKIQYIDINPAFEGHRFCEPGHSWWDQLNYRQDDTTHRVWLWNQPLKYFITLKKGDETLNTWDTNTQPSAKEVEGFTEQGQDEATKDGDDIVLKLHNKDKPDQTLEVRINTSPVTAQDSIARTLHPTEEGHESMGLVMVKKLEETKWPPPNADVPPPAPNNNKALSIMMEKDGETFNWIFYETPRGEAAGCNTDKKPVFKGPNFGGVNIDDPPNPSGDYNMDVWGRPCKWVGNGDNPGQLICGDEHISCQKSSSSSPTIDCPNTGRKQHEGAFCEFFLEGSTSAPPPASEKTKALSIILEEYIGPTPPTTLSWVFFATGFGKAAACDKNGATRLKEISGPLNVGGDLSQIDNPPRPVGTFKLNVHGEDCEYRNGDKETLGGLFCGDKKYDCKDDPMKADRTMECSPKGGFESMLHHPVIVCEW